MSTFVALLITVPLAAVALACFVALAIIIITDGA